MIALKSLAIMAAVRVVGGGGVCGWEAVGGGMASIFFFVPVKTVNESNGDQFGRARWANLAKRKAAKKAVELITNTMDKPTGEPFVVELVRHSAGTLDDDGLRSACKSVRDGVAKWLGINDGDVDRLRFKYGQKIVKRGVYGVSVEIHERRTLVEMVRPVLTSLSDTEKEARKPLPPHILADQIQDSVAPVPKRRGRKA